MTSSAPRLSGGISLGRPFGIPVSVAPSTLLLVALVASFGMRVATANLAGISSGGALLFGAAFGLLLLGSLLLHELSHCAVARLTGLPVLGIRFVGVGGQSMFGRPSATPAHETAVSVAGPAANAMISLVVWLAGQHTPRGSVVDLMCFVVWKSNLALAIFNMMPGLPLDGGRVVQSVVWALKGDRLAATRFASYGGYVIAGLIGVDAAYSLESGHAVSIYGVVLAMILIGGARQSLQAAQVASLLPSVSARRLIRKTFSTDLDLPLAEALRQAEGEAARAVLMVDDAGAPTAVMSGPAVDAVPVERRPWVSLSSVCRAVTPSLLTPADLSGQELLDWLQERPASEYVVVEGTNVLGVLARIDVVAAITAGLRR